MGKNNIYDFGQIIKIIVRNKKTYGIVLAVSIALGLIVSFSIPKRYTAKVMLAPETNTDNMGGSLSSLAAMAGISGAGMSNDAIFPEIYPEVVLSKTFLVGLSQVKVETKDGELSTTLYDYIEKHQKRPWWGAIFRAVGKLLPAAEDGGPKDKNKPIDAFRLTKKQNGVIMEIEQTFNCSVDNKTGVITINAFAQDPLIAAVLADSVSAHLQEFITDYRTNKARNDVANIEKLYKEAKTRYDRARQTYASYADANQDVLLQSFKAKESDLENEMQLQYNIYSQVTTQLQTARAKVIEKTPVYAVIQSSTVPIRHSSPKKMLILLAFMFVGVFGYTAVLMLKEGYASLNIKQ